MRRSPDFARWTSIFRPDWRLRSRKLQEQGGSDREAAVFWLSGGVFQRSGRNCPAAFVQFGRGSRRHGAYHRAGDGHLGQLESDGAGVTHDTRADLDQLELQAGQ